MNVNVLIAGAGPAGSTLSLFLCKAKIPHLIIDKATFPRDKICGDALSGKVIDVLKKLDTAFLDDLYSAENIFTGSYGVKFASPNGAFVDIPFKKNLASLNHPPGFISKREKFDYFLFNRIDRSVATVWENCTIKSLEYRNEGVECVLEREGNPVTVRTKIIVGAEGDRSLVGKQFSSIRKEDDHYCAGLRAYYKGVKSFHERNFIELHFLKELLPGYLWIFPLPGGEANVGVGMLSSVVSKRRVNLKKVMLEAIENNPTIRERFEGAVLIGDIKGWGLPLGSKKRKISGKNFLLLGDAASLIDPFTGEGIGNAMVSGMFAAKQIQKCLLENRFDKKFLEEYDENIYRELWSELKLSYTLQRLSKHGWLFNYVVKKSSRNDELRDTITCMFDDLNIRDRLRSPGFYFRMLFR